MSTTGSGRAAIYARAEEALNAPVTLRPVPSFELYKGAREEELCCYRSLCRVFSMHSGVQLTKQQKRILEDLQEELCVPPERAKMEMIAAQEDVLVTSVLASGVLKRREDFFDGVSDVPLASLSDGVVARDDKGSMFMPYAKTIRTEHGMAAPFAGVSGRRGQPGKTPNNVLLKSVEKIGHEIKIAGGKLLYAASPAERQASQQLLMQKREQLQQLLRDVECQVDVSGNHSALSSERLC
ncbi:ENT domain [Trypanosoma vivax]|nr:hypothetical protein TRVL_04973 [Trypanosoma vivax]KAH8606378.1 ENT domain [Trypanosoma vivax]